MYIMKLPPLTLIFLSLSLNGFAHAADMAIDCKLKGGSVVQLTAEVCKLEGGTPASAAAAPASESAAADANTSVSPSGKHTTR